MPVDTRPKPSSNKPFTPALSTNFRPRPVVAPKLAAAAVSTSPAVSAQKGLRAQTLSPEREEATTTAPGGNITPRSGARSSRYGTDSPATPVVITRSNPRAASTKATPEQTQSRSRFNGGARSPIVSTSTRSNASPSSLTSPRILGARRTSSSYSISQTKPESKFLHANEARPTARSEVGGVGLRSKPSTNLRPTSLRACPPGLHVNESNEKADKFFRVNELSHQNATPPFRVAEIRDRSSGSAASAVSRFTAASKDGRLLKSPPSPSRCRQVAKSQPNSPVKDPKARISSRAPTSPTQSLQASSVRPLPPHRKSLSTNSITASPTNVDTTQGSLTSVPSQPLSSPKPLIEPAALSSVGISTSPETSSPRSTSFTSGYTAATSVNSDTGRSDAASARPKSLIKTAGVSFTAPPSSDSQPQTQPDAASNARRERKVLDLEISNSSLLAINKTLEKELRKQTTELRRFRRLSRSGRLSFAPSKRVVSGQSSIFSLDAVAETDREDQRESDVDGGSDDDTFDYDEEEQEDLSNGSESLASSTARARQRSRDEKRLMLDLSKHHQLLIDSQKLTQSIQRCLNCTDELIRDGNKALNYRVGIGDVKLGGRVLNHDDDDDDGDGDDDNRGEVTGGPFGLKHSRLNGERGRLGVGLLNTSTFQPPSSLLLSKEITTTWRSTHPSLNNDSLLLCSPPSLETMSITESDVPEQDNFSTDLSA